jgi:hypothetical protein
MSFGSESYAGKLTPAEEAHIQTLTRAEDISAYLHSLEVEAGLRVPDSLNSGVLHEVQRLAQPTVAQPAAGQSSLKIDGVTFTGTDAELNEQLRKHFAEKNPQPTNDEPTRDRNGRFVKEKTAEQQALDTAAKANLELRFKRGEIGTAEYLEQSGAFVEAVEKLIGAPIEDIVETFQKTSSEKLVQSWETATREFFQTEEGKTWPGGEANKNKIGEVLQMDLGDGTTLADLPDKVQAMKAAYAYMQEQNLLVENTDLKKARDEKFAGAKSHAEIDELLGRGARGGQIFGSR